jgi:uncharacterized protein (DUF697 family)
MQRKSDMDMRVQDPQDEGVGDLFGQLMEDGRDYARAEVNLYKQIARYRAKKAGGGIAALVAGGVIAFLGAIALWVSFVMGLAPIVGPVFGGVIVAAVSGIAAYILFRYGLPKVQALSGDEEERRALQKGGKQR